MNKLNTLFKEVPKNAVILDDWLKKNHISNSLKQRYLQYGWLRSIGRGASYLKDNPPSWQGAVNALQENGSKLHIGSKTALHLQGIEHFVTPKVSKLYLFGENSKQKLPSWFLQFDWQVELHHCQAAFLPPDLGIKDLNIEGIILKTSTIERAILELLYLVPNDQGIEEAYYIIENLNSLKTDLLQKLLESCHSIKVNRLLFCFGERAGHNWIKLLNKEKINFGSGKRHIITNGYLDPTYNITIPKDWKENETPIF